MLIRFGVAALPQEKICQTNSDLLRLSLSKRERSGAERNLGGDQTWLDATRREVAGPLAASFPLTWMNAHGPELLAAPGQVPRER